MIPVNRAVVVPRWRQRAGVVNTKLTLSVERVVEENTRALRVWCKAQDGRRWKMEGLVESVVAVAWQILASGRHKTASEAAENGQSVCRWIV